MRMWTDRSISTITVNKKKKRKIFLTTKTIQFIWMVLHFFIISNSHEKIYIYISRTMYEKKTQSMPSPISSRKFHFTSDQSWTICECCTVTRHHLGITNNPKGPLSSHVTYYCNFIFEKPEVDTCILSPTNAS